MSAAPKKSPVGRKCQTILDYARLYLEHGLSVIPIRGDGTKAPACSEWSSLQSRLPTQVELNKWFKGNDKIGLAIIHGPVSGNTEVVDVDNGGLYEPFAQECEHLCPGLLDRLTINKTPRPGYHLVYRCDAVEGNQKLAQEPDRECDGKKPRVLIETRGTGGYTIAPGSAACCHATGRLYEHVSGPPLTNLSKISVEERGALQQAARSFNTWIPEDPKTNTDVKSRSGDLSPGDDYNKRTSWEELLEPHGWVRCHSRGDVIHWRRPGKSLGWSATTGLQSQNGSELLCCFSDNAHPFEGSTNGRNCSTYNKFATYTLLNHNGDYSAAARELANLGYGDSKPVERAKNDADAVAKTTQELSEKLGFTKVFADLICRDNHFARDVGGKVYRYRGGAYRSKGENFIKRKVKQLCIAHKNTKKWSKRLSEEVVEYIRVDAPELWERPLLNVVNVSNGLLGLDDDVLFPHTPDHLSPIQLPVKYDPKAICPAIDRFAGEVFPDDATNLAWEIPALLMSPDTSIQKAVLLLGPGGNGKSVYLTMVMKFLGSPNTSAVALHNLETDRFAKARLIGKLANICADLPTEHLEGTSVFKAVTGGDALEAERKFCDSFQFTPYARLVFSANSPPRSRDASEGFFDRWLVVPFEGRFRSTKKEIPRKVLDARLSAPSELSGLLNHAIEAWKRIRKNGRLSDPESVRQAWQEFHAMTDPLSVWMEQFTIDDSDAVIPMKVLRAAYGAACEQAGRPTPTKSAFGRSLRRLRPDVSDAQRTVNGRVQWCYVGIGMRNEVTDTSRDSRDSRDSRTLPYLSQGNENSKEEGVNGEENIKSGKPVNPVNAVKDTSIQKPRSLSSGSNENATDDPGTEVFTI